MVRRNLATIAQTIAKYEPVSMLVRESEVELAREFVGPSVDLVVAPLDDLWMRDIGPVIVLNAQGVKAGVDFNFNGWGEKQAHEQDAQVAAFVAQQAGVDALHTKLVLEGSGIEVDGEGTAIITESCVLNPNRNPGVSKAECEAELKRLLGVEKIIWLPGVVGKDITDGHTDFYARFARPGVVVAGYDPDPESFDHEVTKEHLEILNASTDAQGRPLEVVALEGPSIPSLWTKFVFREPKRQRCANVHVRIDGNPNQRYALVFRDYLRAHPNSARSIELIKRDPAKRHAEDEDAYYDIKDPVYDLIWDAALDWSRQIGWKPG